MITLTSDPKNINVVDLIVCWRRLTTRPIVSMFWRICIISERILFICSIVYFFCLLFIVLFISFLTFFADLAMLFSCLLISRCLQYSEWVKLMITTRHQCNCWKEFIKYQSTIRHMLQYDDPRYLLHLIDFQSVQLAEVQNHFLFNCR